MMHDFNLYFYLQMLHGDVKYYCKAQSNFESGRNIIIDFSTVDLPLFREAAVVKAIIMNNAFCFLLVPKMPSLVIPSTFL